MGTIYPFLALLTLLGYYESAQGASTSLPSPTTTSAPPPPTPTTAPPPTTAPATTTITSVPSTSTTAAPSTTGAGNSSVTTTAVATTTTNASLACYDCTETFKRVWKPYTQCQYYPTHAPLRSCLDEERYCKVEQVSYHEMTVSITRGCTDMCYHGCYAFGFGLTRLKCTSCCRSAGCNTGSRAIGIYRVDLVTLTCCFVVALCFMFHV